MDTAIHVVGIGSPFGWDRVGWWIVEGLRRSGQWEWPQARISFDTLDRPGLSLVESFDVAATLVIIDAVRCQVPAGTVLRLTPDQLALADLPPSSHGLGVAEAVGLAAVLGKLPQRLPIFGIAVGDGGDGDSEVPPPWLNDAIASLHKELVALLGDSVK